MYDIFEGQSDFIVKSPDEKLFYMLVCHLHIISFFLSYWFWLRLLRDRFKQSMMHKKKTVTLYTKGVSFKKIIAYT